MHAVDAAIGRVRAALDQALLRQSVEHAGDRGAVELEAQAEVRAAQHVLLPEQVEQRKLHGRHLIGREPLFDGMVDMLVGFAEQETNTIFIVNHKTLVLTYTRSSKDRKSTRLNSSHSSISYAVF